MFVRSSWSVSANLSFDASTRYVSELPNQQVPAYWAEDAHLGWQPRSGIDLGLYGRNLFDAHHPEFGLPAVRREVPRSVYGKVTCRF